MSLTIRPFNFTEEDYKIQETIEAAVWPNAYETANEIAHDDKTNRQQQYGKYIAELGGTPIGVALYLEGYWSTHEGEYMVYGAVMPEFEAQGVGQALYEKLLADSAEFKPTLLHSWTREDRPKGMSFLEKHGFKAVQREPISQLDLTHFDATAFAGIDEKVASHGIKIYSLNELKEIDPDWKHKAWAMRWPIRQDIPSAVELKQTPFERWVEEELEAPMLDHDAYMIAVATDGEYAAYSNIWRSEADAEKIYTGITGVKRAFRRMGLATALKLRVIDYAIANGVKIIETDNDENNPMLDLNLRLGFEMKPAYITYHKDLTKAEAVDAD